jgi:hypothetical protein
MPEYAQAHTHTQAHPTVPSSGTREDASAGTTAAKIAERKDKPPTTSAVPAYSIISDPSSSPSASDSDSSPVDSSYPTSGSDDTQNTEPTSGYGSGSKEAAPSPHQPRRLQALQFGPSTHTCFLRVSRSSALSSREYTRLDYLCYGDSYYLRL